MNGKFFALSVEAMIIFPGTVDMIRSANVTDIPYTHIMYTLKSLSEINT